MTASRNLRDNVLRHLMVLAVAMAATALSGCWALMGQPQDLAQTRAVIQRENVAADEVAEEREIRDAAVADYRACLHDGGSVRHCSAYLYAQSGAYGWGNGTGLYGLESVAQGAARDIAIARPSNRMVCRTWRFADCGAILAPRRRHASRPTWC